MDEWPRSLPLKQRRRSGAFIKKATQSQWRKSSSKKLQSNFEKSDLS